MPFRHPDNDLPTELDAPLRHQARLPADAGAPLLEPDHIWAAVDAHPAS